MLRLLVLTQQFLAVFAWLVEDVGELLVVLHDVLHHVRLVALEGESRPLHLHNDVEQVKELWGPLLVLGHQVYDRLDLLGQDLQTRRLVPSECLAQIIYTRVGFVFIITPGPQLICMYLFLCILLLLFI